MVLRDNDMRKKMTKEGQPCRKCGTPVVRQTHPPEWQVPDDQWYWFRWWFECPNCHQPYMVNAAKVVLYGKKKKTDYEK